MNELGGPRYDQDDQWMRPMPPAESPNQVDPSQQAHKGNPVESFNLGLDGRNAIAKGLLWDAEETMLKGLLISSGVLFLFLFVVRIEFPVTLTAAVGVLFMFLLASLTTGLYRGAHLENDSQVRLNPDSANPLGEWALLVMYRMFHSGLADAFKHSTQTKGRWLPSAGVALLGAVKTTWWIVAFVTVFIAANMLARGWAHSL